MPGRVAVAIALAGLVVLCLAAFPVGPYPVPPGTVLAVMLHGLGLGGPDWPETARLVLLDVRGPRMAGALPAGGALAAAGAAFQNLVRNPLVSPGVLGVSAGAGFGAVLGILLDAGGLLNQGLAFGFGLAATLMTAACVGISGIVGWVGLRVQHRVRLPVGPGFALALGRRAFRGTLDEPSPLPGRAAAGGTGPAPCPGR